jgi:hypothetical protein
VTTIFWTFLDIRSVCLIAHELYKLPSWPKWLSMYNASRKQCSEQTHMANHTLNTKFIKTYLMRECYIHFPPVLAASLVTFY